MGLIDNKYGIPETTLANFDWYDLSTGTGYKTFYAMDLMKVATLTHVLTTQLYYAHTGQTVFVAVAGEVNFDLDFEVPITIEGVCLISAPISTGQNIGNITLDFTIYHVDADANETQLGTPAHFDQLAFNNEHRINAVVIEIPVTRFKAGETLRLECKNGDPGGGNGFYWLHDPKNRDLGAGAAFVSSQLLLSLPIRI